MIIMENPFRPPGAVESRTFRGARTRAFQSLARRPVELVQLLNAPEALRAGRILEPEELTVAPAPV